MAIKRKDSATIIPKNYANYNPSTFVKRDNFLEVTAEEALSLLIPLKLSFIPEPILSVDTETFYTGVPNNNMPSNVVRRWISNKSGKLIPNDFPFCISISDGRYCVAIYDTLKNGFKEFKKLAPLLSNPDIAKCGHNMSYDLHMLANAGVNMAGRFYDTLHLSKLTRAYAFTHNLLDIATEIQDRQPTVTVYEHMLSAYKQLNRITDYRKFPQELMTQYTCADTWNCLHALIELYPLMVAYEQKQLFDLESETMLVTFRMERTGVMIAAEYENVIIPELQKEMDDAERIIYDQAGYRFNINSTQQVYEVMCKLGYGHLMRRKEPTPAMLAKGKFEGNITLDKAEYERLEELGVPLISSIQTYKKAEKLLNTFAYKLFEMRDSQDRVHCNINTMEAKTGRFSISAPSMQNMPRRADSRIRDAFIAPKGYTLYDFDFKAQESLIMTHYSQAPYLLNIVNNGGDIHRAVAAIIYDVPISEVTKQLREIAKSVEFAIVYGAGPDKVKAMTGLTLEEARMAVNTFKNNVPEVNVFIKTANNVIKSKGYIRTVLGRRVYSAHGREYACVNYLCQGSAADSTKSRMSEIYKFLKANGFKTQMILQVHDSLLQQVADDEADVLLGYLRWLQTERNLFRVTVTVDIAKCEPTWRTKKEIDVPAVKPPEDMLEKAQAYNIWKEGIL